MKLLENQVPLKATESLICNTNITSVCLGIGQMSPEVSNICLLAGSEGLQELAERGISYGQRLSVLTLSVSDTAG